MRSCDGMNEMICFMRKLRFLRKQSHIPQFLDKKHMPDFELTKLERLHTLLQSAAAYSLAKDGKNMPGAQLAETRR